MLYVKYYDSNNVEINIRRSDNSQGLIFSIKDIKPENLKKVFQLQNLPDYLMAENGKIFFFPIDNSDFAHMDSYVTATRS